MGAHDKKTSRTAQRSLATSSLRMHSVQKQAVQPNACRTIECRTYLYSNPTLLRYQKRASHFSNATASAPLFFVVDLRHFPVVSGRWAVTLVFFLYAPMPFLNLLVFLPKYSGFSTLLAFSTVYFIMCTHDSFSDCLFMGAHNKKTSPKCQLSDISTEKNRIFGISS